MLDQAVKSQNLKRLCRDSLCMLHIAHMLNHVRTRLCTCLYIIYIYHAFMLVPLLIILLSYLAPCIVFLSSHCQSQALSGLGTVPRRDALTFGAAVAVAYIYKYT